MTEKQRFLQSAVDALAARKGVQGVVLVRRDGITLLHKARSQISPETFGAMCAVAVGAVETAFSELAPATTPIIRTETKTHRLFIRDANREVILVVIADATLGWDALEELSADAAGEVSKILAG